MNRIVELREKKALMWQARGKRVMPDEPVAGVGIGIDEEDQVGFLRLIRDREIVAQFGNFREPLSDVNTEGIRTIRDDHHVYRHRAIIPAS
jgi:hypothetical protein